MMLNPFKLMDRPRKTDPVETPFPGFARDPFKAVPVRNELAQAREDSRSCLQIRMRPLPGSGRGARLAHKLGFHRDVRVDLDPHGSFFWSRIDGRRTLGSIEREFRREFSLSPEESRKATLLFTKMLMLRHLIQLDIGEQSSGDEPSSAEAEHHA